MSNRKNIIKENASFYSDAAWQKWRQEHWSPLLEFAENHYVLGDDAPVPGLFNIINSPYLAEPFKAWCDARVREVTLQIAAQMGKNMMTEIVMAFIALHMPGNVLFYSQTDEDAEEFMEKRALPRFRSIDVLRHLMPMEGVKGYRQAERDTSIILPHMWMQPYGVNDSNTRSKSAPYVLNDELHIKARWTPGMRSKCKERGSSFWNRKTLNTSTAGDEGSEIDIALKEGTNEVWALGCPECHKLVVLKDDSTIRKWSEKPRIVSWEPVDGEKGWERMYPNKERWNFQEVRKNLRFICPHCQCQHRDSLELRREMNRVAKYVITNPTAPEDHRSFQASQLASWWKSFDEITERWIKAREKQKQGDTKELRLFVIECLGETWNFQITPGGQVNLAGTYELSEPGKFEWEHEYELMMTGDVQEKGGRHIWYVIRAWAKGGKSRLVAAGRAESWLDFQRIQKLHAVPDNHVGVDARFATKEVQEICGLNKWRWLQADEGENKMYAHPGPGGRGIVQRPFSVRKNVNVYAGTSKQGQLFAKGFNYSKSWVREVLHYRLIGQGSPWELPQDVDKLSNWKGTRVAITSYMEQLHSWKRAEKLDKQTNEVEELWTQVYRDDHIRACEEEQIIMASLLGIVPLDVAVE